MISYVDSKDETRRLMLKVYNKRLLNVYCEYSALVHMAEVHSQDRVLCHMNSCRIFHNKRSITFKYSYTGRKIISILTLYSMKKQGYCYILIWALLMRMLQEVKMLTSNVMKIGNVHAE